VIQLRPYQQAAYDEGRDHYRAGRRSVLFVGPTGMGKTVLGGAMVRGAVERGKRVAWYAHTRELVTQAAKSIERMGVEVGFAGLCPDAPCQVTSVQTALARRLLPPADLVFLDEAHHYAAEEWRRVPDAYRQMGARFVGLTATPERADGLGLGMGEAPLFDALVTVCQVADLVELWRADPATGLVPCEVVQPSRPVRKLAQEPVAAYLAHAPGRSAVVFAPHVKAAQAFAEGFARAGIEAGVVHGGMGKDERDTTLARFASGQLRVVVNVMVLTEGWDAPIADVCILARKVGSRSLFLQMVGRVLRPFPGKTGALLVDLVGAVRAHGDPAEPSVYSLDGVACTRKGAVDALRTCRVCKSLIPNGEERCPECDTKLLALEVPEGEGVKLEKFAWARNASTDKMAAALARWQATCIEKGHKLTAADHKFKAVFKVFPSSDVRAMAARTRSVGQ